MNRPCLPRTPSTAITTVATVMLAAAALALVPAGVQAHAGADGGAHHGFVSGLAHPFTGLDHVAAMVAIGVWSGVSRLRVWLAPIAFVSMLLVGALAGAAGVSFPAVEGMIALSLVAIGALLAGGFRAGGVVTAAIVGAFALFHGAAHGMELAGDGIGSALLGMLAGTVVLHAIGIGLGRLSLMPAGPLRPMLPRLAGLAVAVFGVALVVPVLLAA